MRPPLLDVFAAYRRGRTDFPLARLSPARLSWALESGLGPLLARTCRDDPRASACPDWEHILGADLAARVVTEVQADATVEVLRACTPRVGRVTLLKGIWLGHAVYPEPHLRPMRDVDLLVEPDAVEDVERILQELGYEPEADKAAADYREHHHTVPYVHPASDVWIEVHRGLVPRRGPYGLDPTFRLDRIRASLVDAEFRGEPVRRLADELQVAYLAAHWAGSLKLIGGAGGLAVMLDMLGVVPAVDWGEVVRGLQGSATASAVFLLMSYLDSRRLLDLEPRVKDALWRCQRSFGRLNLAFLETLIDRRLADGRAYGRLVWSRRNLEIVWTTLMRPRSALLNLLALPWALTPARWRGGERPSAAP